ncbi:MAG: hypothetical protein WEA36_08025 [Balneolaceae bacterium]
MRENRTTYQEEGGAGEGRCTRSSDTLNRGDSRGRRPGDRFVRRMSGFVGVLMVGLLLGWPTTVSGQAGSLADLRERAVAAGIEESRLSEMVERGAARQFGEEELVQLLTPAVEMAEQGLPGEMVLQKAMEGMAKGVPPAMLNQVLARIRQGAEQSVPIVDRWMQRPDVGQMLERSGSSGNRDRFRQEMLEVGARAGTGSPGAVSVEEILTSLSEPRLLERASPGQIVAAATIMSDLPASTGLSLPDASRMVVRAVQSGFSSSDLQRLPAAVNMAQRRSQLPAASIVEGVGQQMDRGIPASDILQNLFNGNVGGGPPGQIPPGFESRPDRDENHPGRGVSGPPGQGPPVTPPGLNDDGSPMGGGAPNDLPSQDPGGGPPDMPPGQDNAPNR